MKYLSILLFLCLVQSLKSNAQPGDPSGDPDLPKGSKDVVPIKKSLVCDSVQVTNNSGTEFVILYYRGKRVAIYRKEKKRKKGDIIFY
jgi:hypothetical protein